MYGTHIRRLVLIFLWIFQSHFSQSQSPASGGGPRRRQETVDNGFQALLAAAMEAGLDNNLNDHEHPFYSLTPTTPVPEDVECFVEIPATRVGGRCVRLGRTRRIGRGNRRQLVVTRGCQAGIHLDIGSSDCNGNSARRSRRMGND